MRPAPPTDGFSPGRSTTIEFDSTDYLLSQDPWWKSLGDLEITGNAVRPLTDGVHFVHGIGFQLETLHDRMQVVHEQNATAAQRHQVESVLGTFEAAPIKSVPTLTGIPTGSQVEGDEFNQKQVGAGDDWSAVSYNRNAVDGTAYPPPTETEIVPLDRVFIGTSPMRPDQLLWFRFHIPSLGAGASIGMVARVYFVGLASTPNDAEPGTGQYCLSLRCDGQAQLWERDAAAAWRARRSFQWSPSHMVSGAWHTIAIRSDAYLSNDDGDWHGSVINFECQATQTYADVGFQTGAGLAAGMSTTQYFVPQSTFPQNITQVPPRIDVRRDVRMRISLSFTKFIATGVLQSQTFHNPRAMGAVVGSDPLIRIMVAGSLPNDTSVDIALYGKDGTACTASTDPLTFGASSSGAWKSFERIDGQQEYYALLTFNASGDQMFSPTISKLEIVRDGVISPGTTTPWTVPEIAATDYSILPGGMDPTVETASIGLISLQDGFTVADNGVDDPMAPLTQRSGLSCKIKISIPAKTVNGTSVSSSVLFLGKLAKLRRKRLGIRRWTPNLRAGADATEEYPSRTWWQGKAILDGLWKRLKQGKTTQTWNFGDNDPATNDKYRVTKVAEILLSNMGLPSQMLAVPSLPIRLFVDPAKDEQRAFQVEVFSEAFTFVLGLLHDYLGAAVIIDANATNQDPLDFSDEHGCVRVKLPPRPNENGEYLPLARFVEDATWNDGTLRQKVNLNSYAAYARAADGEFIPQCPVLGRTIEDWDEPPEGNVVYVSGAAVPFTGGILKGLAVEQQWAIIHNWHAAVFADDQPQPADPTNPDYTDGSPNLILVIDPSLTTQAAVNFCARRTFDLACHRREYRRFEAPLVLVIDTDDLIQIRPRPLRWGDCVLYEDETWFVSNVMIDVNGERGGTRNTSAVYELFKIPALTSIEDGVSTVYQSWALYAQSRANPHESIRVLS